jgi:hypothetical protein
MDTSSYVSVVAGLTVCVVMILRVATRRVARQVQWAAACERVFARRR